MIVQGNASSLDDDKYALTSEGRFPRGCVARWHAIVREGLMQRTRGKTEQFFRFPHSSSFSFFVTSDGKFESYDMRIGDTERIAGIFGARFAP